MKTKSVVTVLMLVFVGGSVAYMGFKEMHSSASPTGQVASAESRSEPAEPNADHSVGDGQPAQETSAGPTVIAYYFHGDKRCQTCLKLEAYAKEALETSFGDDFDSGRLEWRVVNVDQPGNAHFVEDFQLVTKSVVLVAMKDGDQSQWRNLERIWELVQDKSAYTEYVRDNAQEFLGTAS